MSKKSLFIVIEGLDGSGKSTASKHLKKKLAADNKVKSSYEPHNPSCGGEYIRAVLTKKIKRFSHRTLALAFAANRLDHNDRVIIPWLEKKGNRILICDRYYLSSLVYQSTDEFSFGDILQLNEKARKPDVIFFLNVSNETCYARMKSRNQAKELFEENLEESRQKFFAALHFLKKKNKDNIIEVDGNGTVEETVNAMLLEIEKL